MWAQKANQPKKPKPCPKQELSGFKLAMSGSYLLLSGPWNMNGITGASLCHGVASWLVVNTTWQDG